MNDALSPNKKLTAAATSAGLPMRPTGIAARSLCRGTIRTVVGIEHGYRTWSNSVDDCNAIDRHFEGPCAGQRDKRTLSRAVN